MVIYEKLAPPLVPLSAEDRMNFLLETRGREVIWVTELVNRLADDRSDPPPE